MELKEILETEKGVSRKGSPWKRNAYMKGIHGRGRRTFTEDRVMLQDEGKRKREHQVSFEL